MRQLIVFLWKIIATVVTYCFDEPKTVLLIGILTLIVEYMLNYL